MAVASHSAPASAAPNAASTKISRLVASTRTPSDAAASSLSRIAWIAAPVRLRSSANSAASSAAAAASAHQ